MGDLSPIGELLQEHTHALRVLDSLNDTIDSVQAGATAWADTADATADAVRSLYAALLIHFRKEEEGLFPDLLQMVTEGSEEAGILAGFLAGQAEEDLTAHTVIRLRMQELLGLLSSTERVSDASPQTLHDGLLSSRDLLRRHTQKEERIIFPLIERLLGPRQMAEVGRRMASVVAPA